MKTILFAGTLEEAEAFNARAQAYLATTTGAHGTRWSDIYQCWDDFVFQDMVFGILFDPCVAGAFTEEELLNIAEEHGDEEFLWEPVFVGEVEPEELPTQ